MANQAYDELLSACHKPFRWDQHEFLQGKFIYVRIQDTVLRLNSLGVPWSFDQGPVEIVESLNKTKDGKVQYDAVTHGQLMIQNMGSRGAPGASTSTDKDNASKAAHSFSLRKAASLFGISHYLMINPAEESAFVNHMASADLTDVSDVKKAVALVAGINGMKPLDWLGIPKPSLGDMLNRLKEDGRL